MIFHFRKDLIVNVFNEFKRTGNICAYSKELKDLLTVSRGPDEPPVPNSDMFHWAVAVLSSYDFSVEIAQVLQLLLCY